MTIFIIILVIVIIAMAVQSGKTSEVVANSRSEMVEREENRLTKRIIGLVFFILIAIYGFTTDGIFGQIFGILFGVVGSIGFLVAVLRTAANKSKFANMSEREFVVYQNQRIDEDVKAFGEQSQYVVDPPCPRCGSKDVRTSDDYRLKAAARSAGSMILGQVLGNYTNMSSTQIFVSKQQFKNAIRIEKEYQCNHCRNIWKGEAVIQYKQFQSSSVLEPKQLNSSPTDTSSEQISNSNNVQGLKALLGSGVLTNEEFEQEMKKIQPVSAPVSVDTPTKPKTLKEQVQDLRDLKDSGALTQEEFDAEMNKLLLS